MPGLTGIFGLLHQNENASLINQMLRPMLHENFYSSGNYVNRKLGVFSGFASHDSACPAELTWNLASDISCFICGEPLAASGGLSSAQGDNRAMALIQSYENFGINALEKLNGWFSGLLVDVRRQQTVLFNDRYGLNRIYVHERPGRLFFSSEAKSLLAALPELRELDPRGLAEWFACGCVLGNRTLFCDISLLPPGSAWIFSANGALKKENYFEPVIWETQTPLLRDEFCEKLQQIFPRVLSNYTNGDRPVAMSLTGGLDSRMIMACTKNNCGELPCYTFNGLYRDCADARIAREVAAICGQPHETISVGDEFLVQFPKLAEQTVRITDGAMNVSGTAELYVNRLARQIAPVRLTGNYGSEILRRHIAFKPRALFLNIFSENFIPQLSVVADSYFKEFYGHPLSFIAFKQLPWHHYGRLAIEQSQLGVRSPFLDNELVALAFREPAEAVTNPATELRVIANNNPALGRIPTDRGIAYPTNRMANFVHHSVEEFFARAEYAYDYGMPDWLAKVDRYFTPLHLERLFLGRQKFVHFRNWYRHQLADYVKQILLDDRSRSRAHINGAALEPLVNAHINGTRNCTEEIHKLLSIELLHRTLLEHP